MKMYLNAGKLTVPVVLWGKQAPSHRICQICCLPDEKTLVTGSEDGQICVWQRDGLQQLRPKFMLFGHTFPIICLAAVGIDQNTTRFVSTCRDRKLCLWESKDGRCVESTVSHYLHKAIYPHLLRIDDHRNCIRLFCMGQYPEVLVMDPQDLQVLFCLSSRVEPDWMAAFCLLKPGQRSDIVIGLSQAGMVKIWSLTDLDNRDINKPIYEDESKQIKCQQALTLVACPFNQRMMLVVCTNGFQIYDASDFSELLHHSAPFGSHFISGAFTKIDKVAVHCSNGYTYIYQLPRNTLVSQGQKGFAVDRTVCYCILTVKVESQPTSPVLVKVNDEVQQGITVKPASLIPSFFHLRPPNATESPLWNAQLVFRGDQEGVVSVWQIPDIADKAIMALQQENFQQSPELEPALKWSLNKAWKSLPSPPPGIVDHMTDLHDVHSSITATLYVASQGRLFLGKSDGTIVLVSATQTLARQLLDIKHVLQQKGEDWPPGRILRGHMGAVTCLLYPCEEHSRYETSHLLSGGQDCSVCLWDLNTGSRLYKFCVQAGPILGLTVPPEQCNNRVTQCICSVASDHSVALLSVKESKCILLASRHLYPVKKIRWRPLDDFLLIQCNDGSVYVWQMETASLDRVLTGVLAEEVLAASQEQTEMNEQEEVGASSAVQMLRAIKHKNIAAIKKIAGADQQGGKGSEKQIELLPPMAIQALRTAKTDPDSHLVLFNIEALIICLLFEEHSSSISGASSETGTTEKGDASPLLSSLIAKARDKADEVLGGSPLISRKTSKSSLSQSELSAKVSTSGIFQPESSLYLDITQLLISFLHGWCMDKDLDHVCTKKLGLIRPKRHISFGLVNRQGQLSLALPTAMGVDSGDFNQFATSGHWQQSSSLTTQHLLAVISTANTLMIMQHAAFTPDQQRKRRLVRRLSSSQVGPQQRGAQQMSQTEIQSTLETLTAEQSQIKQGWSLLAALHCVLMPELVKNPPYKPPRIELLARRWQDRCNEIREAAQALLLRELSRVGAGGRKQLIDAWSPFLPPLLHDASISILGNVAKLPPSTTASSAAVTPSGQDDKQPTFPTNYSDVSALDLGPSAVIGQGGLIQMRRNQATAIVLLGVIGAEFGQELCNHPGTGALIAPEGFTQADYALARATSQSLAELLLTPATTLLPAYSPLRRAAMDLLGRGFVVWQPYIDLTRVLLAFLELCQESHKLLPSGPHLFPLSPQADACRTARHALAQIATSRPPAFITALSKEVARFNSAAQHQTLQHVANSPLLKSRHEILRIIDLLSEKQYADVADLMVAVGEILVHCLDTTLLKHKSLAEVFPPITKFHMVSYCPNTRRIAFGGKTGAVVLHELRAGKAQTIQAHSKAVTAVAFSEDGKHLATYSADEGKLNFWQASQSFLGMGQSQVKSLRQLPAPNSWPVSTPGGTPQIFKARLHWISPKAVTLMLPNGKEHRFAI